MAENGATDAPLDNLKTHIYHQCDVKCEERALSICLNTHCCHPRLPPKQGCYLGAANMLLRSTIPNIRKVVCQMFHVFENEMKDRIDGGRFFMIKQCFWQKGKKQKAGVGLIFVLLISNGIFML